MALDTSNWKDFLLADIFDIDYGNKFDKSKMTTTSYSDINFVERTATNNGVVAIVDKVEGVEPYEVGNITLALGGSIGSCFVQDMPYITKRCCIES